MDACGSKITDAPVLAVEGLTKRYGKKEAVSAVSFTVRQAELVGLLGPNGAGKSSTLRMIAGSLAPTSGCVRVTDCDMAEQPASAKSRIGYLPEVPPLYPEMTVREYLRFACDLKNTTSKNTTVDNTDWMRSIVRDLEIEGYLSVLIRNLSKGYKQRVGIAAAIAGKPALLLLDEPVSGLDPRQAAEFRSLLKRICSHMAVIISSHGLLEVASLCTRVIIMKEGRIVADGHPDELAASSGDRKTEIEASGNLTSAEDLVRACARAVGKDCDVVVKAAGEGRASFVVNTGGSQFREQIFRSFAAHSNEVSLDTLRSCGTGLEDVFINLTKP